MAKELDVRKDEAMTPEEGERTRERRVFTPRADVYDTKDAILIVANVPGADEKSLELSLEKNVLTIQAFPVFEQPEQYSLAYMEYNIGDYARSFVIPNEIDREKIEAHVKNGVLHLRLPKAPAAKARIITVKGG
jgi:HSP20 family protein